MKSNPNEYQKNNMLLILKDYADIQEVAVGNNNTIKYIIKQVYDEPKLTPDENYTKYLRPLILDMLYMDFAEMRKPDMMYCVYAMTNNEIAYRINILGDMFHHKAFAKYDDTKNLIYDFYKKYNVMFGSFTNYLLAKLNEDIKYKISYCVNSLNIAGLTQKEIVLNYNNERLNGLLDDAASELLNVQKKTNNFMLEKAFNLNFKDFLEAEYKNICQEPTVKYKLAWEFTFDMDFKINSIDIDLDYCRKMLNINVIHKFIQSNGLKIFKKYEQKLLSNELPDYGADLSELKRFYRDINSKNQITACINDILYIIENISV